MKDSFVYIWWNKTNGKKYIGYHKGSLNDGYICSSHNKLFWEDYNNPDMVFKREIVFKGSSNECLTKEQEILKTVDLTSELYYNNARGASIIFTEEVREKMSTSSKNRWSNMNEEDKKVRNSKIANSKKGIPRSEETKCKLSKKLKGKSYLERFGASRAAEIGKKISESNTGQHYHSDEWKKNLSDKMKGNLYGTLQSDNVREEKRQKFLKNNPGKNKTEETKRKISKANKGSTPWNKGKKRKQVKCTHCGKVGGTGVMQRWHFDNCKKKS